MDINFSLEPLKAQVSQSIAALEKCNDMTRRYGLELSRTQIQNLVAHRFAALKENKRMEFGPGILEKLITAFCDSPYIDQENYEATLLELQELFYHFKNEALEMLSDDELILSMQTGFNGPAQGSLEYLAGEWIETLTRRMRSDGWGYELTFDTEDDADEW